ncbi:MAG: S1 RNA-binding domain-containing protein [bacterium]
MEQPKLQDIEIEIPKKGNIVTGKFLRKDDEYIYINFGYKSEGRIDIKEFDKLELTQLEKNQLIDAEFVDDSFSFPQLSTKKIKKLNEIKEIENKFEQKEIIEAYFLAKTKDRIIVNIGKKTLIEGSISRENMEKDVFAKFYKKNEIIESLIISNQGEYKLSTVEVDNIKKNNFFNLLKDKNPTHIEGKISNIKNDSIIVLFNNYEVEVQRDNLTWGNKKNLNTLFKKNEIKQFKILDVDYSDYQINLTLLEDKDDPTQYIIDSFNSKKEIEGTVINIKDFGIFVEIQNSYDVLIPISECSWNKISKNDITNHFRLGDKIKFQIIEFNKKNKNIVGSIKITTDSPEKEFAKNNSNKVLEVLFRKELENIYLGITNTGLKVVMNKKDISWDNSNYEINLKNRYNVKLIGLSSMEDTLRVSLKHNSENPWNIFKEKYKKGEKYPDLKIISIDDFGLLVDEYEHCKAIIPKSYLDEEFAAASKVGSSISGIVEKYDDKNQKIIINQKKLEKIRQEEAINSFNKSQVEFKSTLGDLLKNKLNG